MQAKRLLESDFQVEGAPTIVPQPSKHGHDDDEGDDAKRVRAGSVEEEQEPYDPALDPADSVDDEELDDPEFDVPEERNSDVEKPQNDDASNGASDADSEDGEDDNFMHALNKRSHELGDDQSDNDI